MKTKQSNLRILRNFNNYPGPQLIPFATNISVSLDPAKFVKLTVTPAQIKTLAEALNTALGDCSAGGTVATAGMYKAFDALTVALNADANDVENVVGTDMEMLLATGYLPVSTNRASSPLDDTAIVSLMNNGSTQLLLRLLPVLNARLYQLQTSTDGGKTWVEAGMSSQARRIVLSGMVPDQPWLYHVHISVCARVNR